MDELIDYFNEGSDLQERDPITGKPIFKAKDVIGEMSSISKVLDELDALEAQLKRNKKLQLDYVLELLKDIHLE